MAMTAQVKAELIGTDIAQVGEEAYAIPHYAHREAHQPVDLEMGERPWEMRHTQDTDGASPEKAQVSA